MNIYIYNFLSIVSKYKRIIFPIISKHKKIIIVVSLIISAICSYEYYTEIYLDQDFEYQDFIEYDKIYSFHDDWINDSNYIPVKRDYRQINTNVKFAKGNIEFTCYYNGNTPYTQVIPFSSSCFYINKKQNCKKAIFESDVVMIILVAKEGYSPKLNVVNKKERITYELK